MFKMRTAIIALLLGLSATAAIAAGTEEERAACSPDARKFCKTAGSEEMAVLFCLKENREKLSKACRKVLADNGQ